MAQQGADSTSVAGVHHGTAPQLVPHGQHEAQPFNQCRAPDQRNTSPAPVTHPSPTAHSICPVPRPYHAVLVAQLPRQCRPHLSRHWLHRATTIPNGTPHILKKAATSFGLCTIEASDPQCRSAVKRVLKLVPL
ncbi:hypothetical protein PIB30_057593 [Stylosanthes scabra]|uniref:Uncharacterized protein n=1 Tax=Stylosanthes scabra TaxID=79078 RepID=A0ABU6UIG3_9FABA|nr:hypothetical protein [Stylosanthes scabra]